LIVFSSSALAACGDNEERSSQVTPITTATAEVPTVTADTGTTAATATTGVTVAPPTTTGATTGPQGTTTTEIGPGAGDEEAIRVPADFEISAAGVTPLTITVPAFLTIALKATSKDGRAHTLRIAGPKGPITLAVPPGGAGQKTIEGLPDGTYPIALDGVATDGALVVGGEPGP